MNKKKFVNIIISLSIALAFVFTVWSYYERIEAINFFIASETVFLLLLSVPCFMFYLSTGDKLLILIIYILLIQAADLSALNFKNIPFADLVFNFIAFILFFLNALLKILLLAILILRLKKMGDGKGLAKA